MHKKLGIILFIALCYAPAHAAWIDGISLSYGEGKPDRLRGARVSVQKWMPLQLFAHASWRVRGYWDLNIARWGTDGAPQTGDHKSIWIAGINPVWRVQRSQGYWQPYIEGSIGVAAMSSRYLGHRDLGANLTFEDIIGVGMQFGTKQQYDVSVRYLHYSNATLAPPNNGIDVKMLLTLNYHYE